VKILKGLLAGGKFTAEKLERAAKLMSLLDRLDGTIPGEQDDDLAQRDDRTDASALARLVEFLRSADSNFVSLEPGTGPSGVPYPLMRERLHEQLNSYVL
jgi:hypothetical protein